MTGSGSFRRDKKVTHRGSSSVEQTSRTSNNTSTPVHPNSSNDDEGALIKKRGRTTCADIQNMPPGTWVLIEVNENMVPCNIPKSILLGSYLGVVARDPILAPISFSD
ncbi:hypothetical protein KFK09_028180 [Dendrobium nobile]|uniref:Uncharacterized protein n=1 Tax=Dendrobium nobile TaxID=94219 RepID=A0A8T3A2G7_DENNO|nr:hypothetical protein KFK09_028180 [Dendrobium nobile]